jgi:AraC-like DNA-binding protein
MMRPQRLFVRLEEDPVHGPEADAPPGTLRALDVPPALRAYLSHVLLYREQVPEGCEIVERVIPDGALRLVCELGESSGTASLPREPLRVIGASAAPAMVRLTGRLHGLSLTLRPGAALSLFGVPAGELAESTVPLDLLWGSRKHRQLLDALADADGDAARLAVLGRALLDSARPADASAAAARAWQALIARDGRMSVREVARQAAMSERRLQQIFQSHVGLSPRTWRRMARLHGCIRRLRGSRTPWTDLAADLGYYDQAHMIRDFKDLCGCTPGEFVRESISHPSNTPA